MADKIDVEKYITVGLKINIASLVNFSGVYDSEVQDIKDKTILLSLPTNDGEKMAVKPGMKLEVSFVSMGGRISFATTTTEKVNSGVFIEVEKPLKVDRKELREFFRVEINRTISIFTLKEDNLSQNFIQDKEYKVTCMDISGGGAKLISSLPIEKTEVENIQVDFSSIIPNFTTIYAKILRYSKTNDNRFEIGIQFVDLRDSDRDKIIKYVFKRQIELRVAK